MNAIPQLLKVSKRMKNFSRLDSNMSRSEAGSKSGSIKCKLKASTFHDFCPKPKKIVPDSKVPDNVNSIYEIVKNGLNSDVVKKAMAEGIKAAAKVSGVVKISAGNYGGKLGPFRAYLKEALELK
jgi:formylmethanofuran--tetrahydromethanopterin N-formyltransferase